MKIALSFIPVVLEKNWSTLRAQQENMGIIPPLSLCYVAAIAEKAGHKVIIIDAIAERLAFEEVVERIKDFSPDLLGFTITTYGFRESLNWIQEIKSRTRLPVVVGGWHVSLYPYETLNHKFIDYAVTGEGDVTIPEFLAALENGKGLKDIEGIAFRDNGNIFVTPFRKPIDDIDTTPFPSRHLLKKEKYYNILTRRKNFTAMLSGRGCPFKCVFCDLNTKKFRLRSAKNFVDEMEQCYGDFGIKEFDIYDSSFTVDKKRVIEICNEMKNRNLKMRWTVRTRVDCVDKPLLEAMADAGCSTIMYGIESGSPEVLRNLRKDDDIEITRNVIRWTKEYGINALGFFMIGSPGETRETIKKTINFSIELDLDYVQFTKTTAFTNTELYQRYIRESGNDHWREFTLNPEIKKELPLIGTKITVKEALRWVRWAYIRFFFRFRYIYKAVRRLKSWLEFKNEVKAALCLIFYKQHN